MFIEIGISLLDCPGRQNYIPATVFPGCILEMKPKMNNTFGFVPLVLVNLICNYGKDGVNDHGFLEPAASLDQA